MPVHYNDGLDDQLAYDLSGSFIGGQVSNVRANLLKEGQFHEAKNMDIDKFGAISTRRGTSIVGSTLTNPIKGLTFFDTPSYEEILAVSNGVLYKSTGSTFSSVSGYTPSASNNVEFAQLVDKMFMTDGSGNLHSYNGSAVTDEGSSIPRGKFLISHTNRLFSANNNNYDDEVAASDILDGTTWGTGFQFRVGGGEGDPITGIVGWYNFNLVVFKERSIHVVVTDPSQSSASSWAVNRIDNTVGCVSGRTIAQAGSDVFFLARDGIRTVRTILSGAQSSVSEPISTPIDDIIQRINWGYAQNSCAKFWNNRYIISVPLDNATTPDYTIVFNTVTRSWSGYWTGWTNNVYAESAFNNYPKLIMGDNSGNVLTWLDYVNESSLASSTYQDNSVDIESFLISRGHVYGDYLSPKLGNHLDIEFENSIAGCHCAEVYATLDEEAGATDVLIENNIPTQTSSVTLPVTLPFTLPSVGPFSRSFSLSTKGEFNEARFKIKASSGRLLVRSIKTSAFMNTMALER